MAAFVGIVGVAVFVVVLGYVLWQKGRQPAQKGEEPAIVQERHLTVPEPPEELAGDDIGVVPQDSSKSEVIQLLALNSVIVDTGTLLAEASLWARVGMVHRLIVPSRCRKELERLTYDDDEEVRRQAHRALNALWELKDRYPEQVTFVNTSGGETNEAVLKLARSFNARSTEPVYLWSRDAGLREKARRESIPLAGSSAIPL